MSEQPTYHRLLDLLLDASAPELPALHPLTQGKSDAVLRAAADAGHEVIVLRHPTQNVDTGGEPKVR